MAVHHLCNGPERVWPTCESPCTTSFTGAMQECTTCFTGALQEAEVYASSPDAVLLQALPPGDRSHLHLRSGVEPRRVTRLRKYNECLPLLLRVHLYVALQLVEMRVLDIAGTATGNRELAALPGALRAPRWGRLQHVLRLTLTYCSWGRRASHLCIAEGVGATTCKRRAGAGRGARRAAGGRAHPRPALGPPRGRRRGAGLLPAAAAGAEQLPDLRLDDVRARPGTRRPAPSRRIFRARRAATCRRSG